MAQQQTENLNDVGGGGGGGGQQSVEDKKNLQNGTDGTKSPAMNEKIKSPPPNNGNDGSQQPPMTHQPMPPHHPPPHPSHHPYDQSMYGPPPPHGGPPHGQHHPPTNDKDEMNHMYGHGHPPPPPGHPHHYGRYHHDPNMDHYRYAHPQMPVPGGKPGGGVPPPGVIGSPSRPPPQQQQRYIPGQTPQGPTPTLNSLLQSHGPSSQQQQQPPPPPQQQHRYSNNYDPPPPGGPQQQPQQQPLPPTSQSSQNQQPPSQHQPPPPGPYGGPQQGWAPPPRPYSPQMGPSQQYRTPPPANPSRGQSTYPPPPQGSGSYPSSPQQPPSQQQQQQPGGPPPNSNQAGGAPPPPSSQYAPYPQRYPTPPTGPNNSSGGSGPNHRTPYSHQYPEPNRPWPGSPSPAPSPGPGGHPLPSASPHQQNQQPPPPSSPSGGGGVHAAPSPSPQPSQASPSPHQELIGQNSNDSSSGGGVSGTPGTPNSQQQVMRPTPSPTGSAGSRSLSPAIGQRPSSNQSQSSNSQQPMPPTTSVLMPHTNSSVPPPPTSSSNSQPGPPSGGPPVIVGGQPPPGINSMPTSTPGTYPTQAPPHMMGYKGPQGQSPYPPPPQGQQYSQGNYPPRPQYYGPGAPPPGAPTSQTGSHVPPPPGQYQGRQMPNHQYPPGGYQQSWVPPSPGPMGNHVQGKGTPPPPGPSGSPRPINYLKQHLQHKGGPPGPGYGSQTPPPQGYGNGPGMHMGGPMGPPHHMGPPSQPMGPPISTPLPPTDPSHDPNAISQDNGVPPSSLSSTTTTTTSGGHPVTSVITTGPDGAAIDEASQQSTLSNASAASGEDPQCTTPKSRKNDPYNQSHLSAPITSPGAGAPGTPNPYPPPHPGSIGGGSDDFDMRSPPPSWPSTPASPGFNSHVQQETFRPTPSNKKSDSLGKLYEMDDMPDRRPWLDKLLGFMEERKTPITACPTISKTPLDLYRLYLYVKERGGFVEVCKVTKSKTWKDIAGLLGIGASSSAAYTLRKHYTKNLLAFECHFDRGGIDPTPIIAQVEAGSKKKASKAASVPSPAGSSNSQDSFPNQTGANTNIDGYPGYTGPGGYPPPPGGPGPDYNAVPQRPPSQSNAQTHPGPYPGQPGYNQYGATDQYNSGGPPGQYQQNQGQFPPPNRAMYPPYGPEGGEGPPPGSNAYGPYGSRPYNQPPGPGGNTQPPPQASPAGGASTPPSGPPPTGPPGQQGPYPPAEYNYRPPDPQQQRRHPDFVKDNQPYPGYNQRPQMYGGWQGGQNQYRSGPYANAPPQSQNWPAGPRQQAPGGPQGASNQQPMGPGGQWDHRYPPQSQPPYPQPGAPGGPPQQWGNMPSPQQPQPPQQPPSGTPGSPLRPPNQQPRMPLPPGGKPFNMPPPPQTMPPQGQGPPNKIAPHHNMPPHQQMGPPPQGGGGAQLKKEITFPADSVEATTPNFVRRKRLTRADVCPIDPWRIFMAMRSGLLAESTWALDLLNILLFDDSAVHYFGLTNLPGLLNLLLEHFQKNLSEMFDEPTVNGKVSDKKRRRCGKLTKSLTVKQEADENDNDIDLGQIKTIPNGDDRMFLLANTPNYTMMSRKGVPVKIQSSEEDIFISDHARPWDMDANRNYQYSATAGSDAWNYDQFEPDPHENIIDVFKSEIIDIPFARCYRKRRIDEVKCEEREKEEVEREQDEERELEKNDESEKENIVVKKEPMELDDDGIFNPIRTVRDPATILKRRKISDFEDECYTRDEASIHLINESHDSLARRCICISNIFRNLTFVPGNETILAKSPKFLAMMGKLLLLNHEHLIRTHKTGNYDREEDTDFTDSCSSLQGEKEWWWEYLIQIRENMLVAVANIAGHLELSRYEEIIARPVLDGLLHWAICPSAHGQDPFPSCGPHSALSPQRLALEALCKLCVTDANVDLVIATPPFNRLEKLCAVLTRHLCKNEDQVLREFSVNLLHYLAAADSAMARTVALQSPCISYLVTFIEQAEQTALGVANQHGINYLRENPDSMGTSLDMLRRAAGTLLHLSRHPDNKSFFMQQEQRLLGLVMSHILDQQVALIISRVLFQVSRAPPSPPAMLSSKTATSTSTAVLPPKDIVKKETAAAVTTIDDTNSSDSSVVPPNDISNSSNSSLSNCSSEATTSSTTPTTTSLSTTITTTATVAPPATATKTTPATATQAAVA
ncbi:ARID1B family protein [Megaselia abdita]